MKNKGLTIKIGISIFVTLMLVLMVLIFKNSVVLNKTYAYDAEGITNIAQFVDEGNNDVSSASFILQDLDNETLELQENNKYKVFCNDENLTITLLDARTNDPISSDKGIFTMSTDGITVKVDGLEKNNKYDIIILPLQSNKGYKTTYSEATIELDYTDVLSASIKEIKDWNDNNIELSENDRIVFLYTDVNDKIKLRANSDIEIEYYYSLDELNEEELASKEFTSYDKANYLRVSTNGYLYAKAKYKNSSYSKISMLHITNIDKLNPIGTVNNITESDDHMSATINFNIDDQEATKEYGKSEVVKYAFTKLQTTPSDEEWISANSGNYSKEVFDNGTYYIHTLDKAGNTSITEVDIDDITYRQEGYYILILESDDSSLVGKYYNNFRDFKEDLDSHNLNNNSKVKAQIEGNILNQYMTVENVNLTIDLNGYILESRLETPNFSVIDGATLKIVDNKYEINEYLTETDDVIDSFQHGSQYGSIKNTNSQAIIVNQGAVLQLGEDNSVDLAHIEYPDHHSPYISGISNAITNHGTFNYYDGILYGGIALDGEVQDTPYIYDPSTIIPDGDTNFYMSLEKVTNVEALIGKTRYTLLEDAIYDANNIKGDSSTQIEIDIVRDLSKLDTVYVDNTKNIILDLNGFAFTNEVDKSILDNSGKLKIIDSNDPNNTGIISNENASVIINNSRAYLEVESGTIIQKTEKKYAIYNDSGASLIINGGEFQSTGTNNTWTIYNDGGYVEINDGKFLGTNNRATNYIYNKDKGVVGDIESSIPLSLSRFGSNGSMSPFELNLDGYLQAVPNQKNQYFKAEYQVDLSSYKNTDIINVEVLLDANIRNHTDLDGDTVYGYIDNRTNLNENINSFFNTYNYEHYGINRFYLRESADNYKYSTDLAGGSIYYLYIYYYSYDEVDENTYVNIKNININKYKTGEGTIIINNGDFTSTTGNTCLDNYSRFRDNNTISGGNFNCNIVSYDGSLTINDGNFDKEIVNKNTSNAYIHGGTINKINNTYRNDFSNTDGIVTIDGGTIKNVNNESRSALYITGGTFTESITNGGEMEIKNAYVTGMLSDTNPNEHVYHKLYIDNTTFDSTENNNLFQWVANGQIKFGTNDNDIIINNTKFVSDRTNRSDYYNIIVTYKVNLTIKDSIFDTSNDSPIYLFADGYKSIEGFNVVLDNVDINTTNNAITGNVGARGNINIGIKDNNYNENNNIIKSSKYAVYSPDSYLNFYDGVVKGKTKAVNNTISDVENTYTVYEYIEGEYDCIKLDKNLNNVLNVNKNKYYDTLADALKEVDSGSTTLKYMNNNIYETSKDITIDDDLDLTVDFNGNNVYFGNGYINNGELKFTNTSSVIPNILSKQFINNNSLNIEAGNWLLEFDKIYGIINNGVLNTKDFILSINPLSKEEEHVIDNSGTINLKAGTVINDGTSGRNFYYIYNHPNANLYLNGETINVYNHAQIMIYNKAGNIEINDGTINIPGNTRSIYSEDYTENNHTIRPNVTINGGNFISDGSNGSTDSGNGFIQLKNTNFTMTGGTFKNVITGHLIRLFGDTTGLITDGYIENSVDIWITDTASATIDNLSIKDSRNNGILLGDYNKADCSLTINNININSTGRNDISGINVQNGSLNMTGGTINIAGGSTKGIQSNSSKPITLQNVNVNMTSETNERKDAFAIYIDKKWWNGSASGDFNIISGSYIANCPTLTGTVYGLFSNGTSSITLGTNDNSVSITDPVINGNTYGLYHSNGQFNFYDGIIKGNTQIYGGANNRPELYEIEYGNDGTLNTAYLAKVYIAENNNTHEQFYTIQEAFNSCSDNSECNIKLLRSITLDGETTISQNKKIIFNLNTYNIEVTENKTFINNGTITFKNGKLFESSINNGSAIVTNNGELTFDDNIVAELYVDTKSSIISNNASGRLFINAGTYSLNNYFKMIINNDGYVEINDGTFNTNNNQLGGTVDDRVGQVIWNKNGEVVINDGTFNTKAISYDGLGIYYYKPFYSYTEDDSGNNASITINNMTLNDYSEFYGWNDGIFYIDNSNLVINGGDFASINGESYFINTSDKESNIVISGGSYNNFEKLIYSLNDKITINNASITNNIRDHESGIIYIDNSILDINNMDLKSNKDNSNNVGIYLKNDSILNMYGGSIVLKNGYGIKSDNKGIINLGNNEDDININNPIISAKTYGIYRNDGEFNFYDGIIKSTNVIFGGVSNRPVDSELIYGTENELTTVTLRKEFVVENLTTSNKYLTLNAAIDDCQNNSVCKLRLLYDVSSNYMISIDENKNINLDLNNFTINTVEDKTIINKGILEVYNGKITEAAIQNDSSIIYNEGDLIINDDLDIELVPDTLVMGIYNKQGNVYINNGTFVVKTNGPLVYNENGYVEINDGTFDSSESQIQRCGVYANLLYNKGGNIAINGGNYNLTSAYDDGYYTCMKKSYPIYNTTYENSGNITRSELNIKDGQFSYKGNHLYTIYSNNSDINITNGTFTSTGEGGFIHLDNAGNNLIINNITTNNYINAIYSKDDNDTLIHNGTFTNTNTKQGSLIRYENGDLGIKNININISGDLSKDYTAIELSGNSITNIISGDIYSRGYGIKLLSNAKLTLGENEGLVSTSIPSITGLYAGINNLLTTTEFNFYDGIISSDTSQIEGNVTEIPQDYHIVSDGYSYYLEINSQIEDTFEYNNIYFQTIDMPIETISKLSSKTGTIKIWNNVIFDKQIVIPSGVNITLALEGHQLSFADGIDTGIINNGNLTIIDGFGDEIDETTDSSIINIDGIAIQNNGTLTIGTSNNPNRQSPKIKGTTAITGNNATLLSGKIESTDGGIIQTVGAFLSNLFTFNIEPSYSYKTSTYQVNKLPEDIILATSPTFRAVESLIDWTNKDINVGMTSHNVGVLSLVSDRDPNETKKIEYTIEVYKNGVLDEFYTYKKVVDVQYLDNNILDVDLDWFDGVENKFKDYYLAKMTVNDEETTVIPELVYDGTVIKLYYGQTKGEEIELVNPKTGRKSYKKLFGIALIAFIISIFAGVLVYKGSKKTSVYNI